ncbi:MAG: hypothetical protein JSS87_02265 [Acidobacteria bacterium]|nr:hypothetical protein [Acidobacteriota bacterium]
MDRIEDGAVKASWPFHAIEGKGHVRLFRVKQGSAQRITKTQGAGGTATRVPGKHTAHFGRSLGDLIPVLAIDPASAETSSITVVNSNGSQTTIRIAPVNRSFSLLAQKQAGAIVDLTIDTEAATLVRAIVRLAGCEHTDTFARILEFGNYTTINRGLMPSTIITMQADIKHIYHIQSVRVEQ